jgi:hypothetical protein
MASDDEMTDSNLFVRRLTTLFEVRIRSFEWTDDRSLMEIGSRCLIEALSRKLPVGIQEKHENPSVRIAAASVNIRTEKIPNISEHFAINALYISNISSE